MGVAIQEITPALAKSFKLPEQRKGVLISDVNENGPSHTAGMKRGDVVVAFNGKEVQSVSQLRNLVARTTVGKDADIRISAGGQGTKSERSRWLSAHRMMSWRSASRLRPPRRKRSSRRTMSLAALRVQTLDAAMMSQLNLPAKTTGVVVSSVETGSPAESAGLQRGDVIQEINHEVVKSLEDYQKSSAQGKKRRDGRAAAEPAGQQPLRCREPEITGHCRFEDFGS